MGLALLIIDLQKAYFQDNMKERELDDALEYINEASKLFREEDRPVVIIQHASEYNRPGTPGFGVVDGLVVKDSDYRITKTFGNAFWETELEELLSDLEADFVVCAGYAANHCVLFTYNGARERGLKSVILKNGIVGKEKNHVNQVYEQRDTISLDTIGYILRNFNRLFDEQ